MPKLAGYGVAIETYEGDLRNPGVYNSRAIPLFIVPVILALASNDRQK